VRGRSKEIYEDSFKENFKRGKKQLGEDSGKKHKM
jgi:hypothetical protein